MKTEQSKCVPGLRFPGFVGAWKLEQLHEITSKKISYGIVQAGEHIPGGMPYIKSQDLNQPLALDSLQRTSAQIARKYHRSEVEPGDIVFSLRGNIGISQIVPLSVPIANLTQGTARIAVANHDNRLVAQTLQTTKVAREIDACAKGSTFREISLEALRKISLPLAPTLPEQRKIADFLTAVDGRIGQLIQKKALLEDYKKGVMQQLFTQAIRFKDDHGNDFPEWVEKKLGALCSTFKSGKGITSGAITENGEYPVYGGNGMRGYTDVFTHDGEFLLIGRQGALCGNINRVRGKSFVSEHAIAVAGNKFANTEWLAQRLDYLNLNRLSESSAQPGLAVNKLERLKLLTPSFAEQTKIADFLSVLDRKIESVATQITETQTFKRGLLQQMFV